MAGALVAGALVAGALVAGALVAGALVAVGLGAEVVGRAVRAVDAWAGGRLAKPTGADDGVTAVGVGVAVRVGVGVGVRVGVTLGVEVALGVGSMAMPTGVAKAVDGRVVPQPASMPATSTAPAPATAPRARGATNASHATNPATTHPPLDGSNSLVSLPMTLALVRGRDGAGPPSRDANLHGAASDDIL